MTHTLNMEPALRALGEPARCPTLEQVRNQKVWFYPRHWLARWPQGLEIPLFLRQDDDADARRAVTRDDLFALGRVSLNRDRAPPYWVHGHHRPLPAAHR